MRPSPIRPRRTGLSFPTRPSIVLWERHNLHLNRNRQRRKQRQPARHVGGGNPPRASAPVFLGVGLLQVFFFFFFFWFLLRPS
jgi:hypothetical protein